MAHLPEAVQSEAQKKYQSLLSAVNNYQRHDEKLVSKCSAQVIWRKGNARLLDYGADMKSPIKAYAFIVPSLINRYYILDLSERRSFVQYMSDQGIYPLLLDWDEPGETESKFDMADYVTEVLLPALKFANKSIGEPLHLLGYCLGGVLSLAAAQLKPEHVASLSLLATPWNFHSSDVTRLELSTRQLEAIKDSMLASPLLSATALEWLFITRNPFSFQQKFLKFNTLQRQTDIDDFVTMEHWISDNVAMASPAAVDCFIHWAGQNQLHQSKWKVGGKIINPKHIKMPCFVTIPEHDQIVPTGCAKALADILPNATIQYPNAGHVGMVVGRNARRSLWQPYRDFILQRSI